MHLAISSVKYNAVSDANLAFTNRLDAEHAGLIDEYGVFVARRCSPKSKKDCRWTYVWRRSSAEHDKAVLHVYLKYHRMFGTSGVQPLRDLELSAALLLSANNVLHHCELKRSRTLSK